MSLPTRKRLGEMLVEAGVLSAEALTAILAEQRRSKLKLGQFLIQKGVLTENRLIDTLSKQLKIKRWTPDLFEPNPKLAGLIPEELARKYRMLPGEQRGPLLHLILVDPTDISAMDVATKMSRLDVEPVICDEAQFYEFAKEVYGKSLKPEHDLPTMELEDVDVEAEPDKDDSADLNIGSLQSMAEDAPVVKLVNSILVQAFTKRASDVHFSAKADRVVLKFRVDGELIDMPAPPKKYFTPLVSRMKLLSNLDISVSRIPQDGRFTYRAHDREVSVRTSTLPTIYGEKIVMRLHVQSGRHMSLGDLGLEDKDRDKIERAITKPYGMILATGPTGSGKTTLLYAILKLAAKPTINVITLEDPVESRLDEVTQVQLNTRAGMTFASGLRAILRQDPDVIMIGEIRDQETAGIAIESAMTGHKVISTLHTNDAPGAVTRFVEMEIEPFLIASTLLVVSAQRLIRRICPECLTPYEAPKVQLKLMDAPLNQKMLFFKGEGCAKCDHTGYKGRLGVYEILEVDDQVAELIIHKASAFEIKQALVKAKKMTTLKMDAAMKVFRGLTTIEQYLMTAY